MEEKIKRLKGKLQKVGTRDLLGMIGTHFIIFSNGAEDFAEQSDIFNKTNLISPQKQYTYLAGLLMSTEDKSGGIIIENIRKYDDLENDVQEITLEYIKNFMDIDVTLNGVDDAKRNLVSMEAFTSYFDTGILRYPEQTIDLIKTLYGSFDVELQELTGLTIEDYILFYELVFNSFSESMDASKNAMDEIKRFLESLNPYAEDTEQEYQRLLKFGKGQTGANFKKSIESLNTIKA